MPKRSRRTGKFVRTRQPWTPDKWDDGYVDSCGRFRVYRPDYPNAYALGYALRAHVVWWLSTGNVHPWGNEIHHINHDRLDDRFENLMLLAHSLHQKAHKKKFPKTTICKRCKKKIVPKKRGVVRVFCSQRCYQLHPKSAESRKKLSDSLRKAYREGRKRKRQSLKTPP